MQSEDENMPSSILSAKTIAIVGLSKDEAKPSNEVARYLIAHGKKIIAVNPAADGILGQKCYKSLLEIPPDMAREIGIVDVFRKSGDVLPIAKDAIELRRRNANGKPEIFWMQIGIINEAAASEAEKAGFVVIMDRCVKIEHEKRSR